MSIITNKAKLIPNFCRSWTLFSVVIITQLVVLILMLAPGNIDYSIDEWAWWKQLGLLSAFAQWLAISCASALCFLRIFLIKMTLWVSALASIFLVFIIIYLESSIIFWLDNQLNWGYANVTGVQTQFIWGTTIVGTLVWIAAFRYFYLIREWQYRTKTEAQAQFRALQARIRPHFLFNSMNVIASLVRKNPDQAEQAIEDLSDLFRAALSNPDKTLTTLADEVQLVKGYLNIEKLRLARRLTVKWDIADIAMNMKFPPLMLQPLAENAINHGVSLIKDGGEVIIKIYKKGLWLFCEIENDIPFWETEEKSKGHGIALKNIRDRMKHTWQDRATLTLAKQEFTFKATLKIPLTL